MYKLSIGLSVLAIVISLFAVGSGSQNFGAGYVTGAGVTNFDKVDAKSGFLVGGTSVINSSAQVVGAVVTSGASSLTGATTLQCAKIYNGATTTTAYYIYANATSVLATTTKPALCP